MRLSHSAACTVSLRMADIRQACVDSCGGCYVLCMYEKYGNAKSGECTCTRRNLGDAKTRPRDACQSASTRVTFVTDAFPAGHIPL